MLLNIASIFIFLFVAFNLFFRAHCPFWVKIIGVAILFLASMKYQIYQILGGAFFAPQMSRELILLLEVMYGALLILFFLLLLWDIYLVGNWLLAKAGFPIPKKLPSGLIKSGLCFLALALGIYGVWQAVKVPNVKEVEMRISDLPSDLEGFSIVQLSDLHVGPLLKKDWLSSVVAKVNALNPDLIALTGDYIDGRVSEIEAEISPLADLHAKYGIFGVTGNHEYYWNATEWIEALKNLGIHFLNNEHTVLQVNEAKLIVAGIPDLAASRFGLTPPDFIKAMQDAPEGLRVLLAHQPKIFKETQTQTDIQLSGHTHGGIMFFIQPLIARFNEGFVAGLYPQNNKNLYVSPGTGLWNGFSCRVGVPAEISRIILRKA